MHQLTFLASSYGSTVCVGRNEALRAYCAAIYDTAKVTPLFTTDDVYPRVLSDVSSEALRAATASSKLIAVAFAKLRSKGLIRPTKQTRPGDARSHGRPKRVWKSRIAA